MIAFDDVIIFDKEKEIVYNQWIEWHHFLIPNKPNWFREILRNILSLKKHCKNCTALDGCYFVTRTMPELPLHPHCDCKIKNISYNIVADDANAFCDITKFTEYVFKNSQKSKGKIQIFHDLGFNINDSYYLQSEYNKQALAQYLKGNYILKKLDEYGQRIAIPISLNGTEFYSGWMLYPEGKIKNTTPFGGWIK